MRVLRFLLLPLMLLVASQAAAQDTGKLSGRVVDDLGNPLAGANVVVESTQLGTAADIDGNYLIIGVPPGKYEVTVSCREYQERFDERVAVLMRQTTVQHFEITIPEKERLDDPCIAGRNLFCGECRWSRFGREILGNLPIRGVADLGPGGEVYKVLSPEDRERIAELIAAYEQPIAGER